MPQQVQVCQACKKLHKSLYRKEEESLREINIFFPKFAMPEIKGQPKQQTKMPTDKTKLQEQQDLRIKVPDVCCRILVALRSMLAQKISAHSRRYPGRHSSSAFTVPKLAYTTKIPNTKPKSTKKSTPPPRFQQLTADCAERHGNRRLSYWPERAGVGRLSKP
jgi:hypothetical protein